MIPDGQMLGFLLARPQAVALMALCLVALAMPLLLGARRRGQSRGTTSTL